MFVAGIEVFFGFVAGALILMAGLCAVWLGWLLISWPFKAVNAALKSAAPRDYEEYRRIPKV